MRGISWLTKELLPPHERLCSRELVGWLDGLLLLSKFVCLFGSQSVSQLQQRVPLMELRRQPTILHGLKTQKTVKWSIAAVRSSNHTERQFLLWPPRNMTCLTL